MTLPPAGEAPTPVAPQLAERAADLLTRGEALHAQDKDVEGLTLFERATQFAPPSFEGWFNKALTLLGLGGGEEALAVYDRALVLDLDDAEAWSGRGDALSGLVRFAEAAAAQQRAKELGKPW